MTICFSWILQFFWVVFMFSLRQFIFLFHGFFFKIFCYETFYDQQGILITVLAIVFNNFYVVLIVFLVGSK